MKKTLSKRGRPPKEDGNLRADYLDIRLLSSEKQTFRDAADLAGLDLSAWVRGRLRMLARKELEAASQPVAFLVHATEKPVRLIDAKFIAPSSIRLKFTDKTFTLAIRKLEMPVDRIKWKTAAASPTGEKMMVKGVKGDDIPIDAPTLRYLVDAEYAARIDASLDALQLSRKELAEMARDNPPPDSWYDEPAQDLARESWK
ncbi:MAG: hypothetical protein HY289_12255 [Planctomycetes bacterium]|nr:hypothetical protein [Planctomycetota bacterium]